MVDMHSSDHFQKRRRIDVYQSLTFLQLKGNNSNPIIHSLRNDYQMFITNKFLDQTSISLFLLNKAILTTISHLHINVCFLPNLDKYDTFSSDIPKSTKSGNLNSLDNDFLLICHRLYDKYISSISTKIISSLCETRLVD